MEKIIEKLAESIESNLIHDMHNEQDGDDIAMLVLAAYNRYQEDEKDGSYYICDIHKGEDLKSCIDGGMTAHEIASLNDEYMKTFKCTPYFMFGRNHTTAEVISSWEQLKRILCESLHEVVMHMLAHQDVDGYKQLYNLCISDYMINNNLV